VSRYFVTGATGFVGAEVAKQLRTRGHQVVALVRSPEKASLLAKLGCELHVDDIMAPGTLRAGMRGADGMFHLAAWYRLGAPRARPLAEAVNIEGTRHVLDVMRELGIARGVYTSSLAVFSDTHGALVDESYRFDGPHLSLYDDTKWRAHYEVALPAIAQGLPLIIVQPGVVYGPGDTSAVRSIFVTTCGAACRSCRPARPPAGDTWTTRRMHTSRRWSADVPARATSSPARRTRCATRCGRRRGPADARRRSPVFRRRCCVASPA
jgi:nucleoside-diphosphate-sugar epimerase